MSNYSFFYHVFLFTTGDDDLNNFVGKNVVGEQIYIAELFIVIYFTIITFQ